MKLLLGLSIEGIGFLLMLPWGDFREPGHSIYFLLASAFALMGYALACLTLSKQRLPSWAAWLTAVLFRLCLLPMYPGDDIWRYVWEGRIQNFEFNPYLLAPNSALLESLRTSYWPLINHPDYSAIYPPLAEITFRGLSWLNETPLLFKTFFALADLGIVYVLQGIIRQLGTPMHRLWFYAWNPLVIYCFAGGGHFDSLMILSLMASLLCLLKGREVISALLLTLAILFKEVALVALPFYAVRMKRKYWLLFLAAAMPLPGLIFYGHPFPQFWESLRFWEIAASHGSLATLIPREKNFILFVIFLVGWIGLVKKFFQNPTHGIHHSLAWLVMISPSVHPWYLTWILAFTGLTRFKAWWVLSGTMFFYFLHFLSFGDALIYVPFYGWLAVELCKRTSAT